MFWCARKTAHTEIFPAPSTLDLRSAFSHDRVHEFLNRTKASQVFAITGLTNNDFQVVDLRRFAELNVVFIEVRTYCM
jgi:hypothetical protein